MQAKLAALGFHVEERSWLNPVEGIWSVHVRDRDCPLLFTNGKGATQTGGAGERAGRVFRAPRPAIISGRITIWARRSPSATSCITRSEQWFQLDDDGSWPERLADAGTACSSTTRKAAVDASALVDLNSGNAERGICALPYMRQRDGASVWFPVNIIGNLYVSNGMSAGNTPAEARTQALSEIFERHVKFRIIAEGLCLPDVPEEVIARYPRIAGRHRATCAPPASASWSRTPRWAGNIR